MSEPTFPPTTFHLIPNAFRPRPNYDHNEGLINTVKPLVFAHRYRSAMDEILKVLNDNPEDAEALRLAVLIAGASRTDQLQSSEPLPPSYLLDRRLDPIFAVCSHCRRMEWVPRNCVLPVAGLSTLNPVGLQCYSCGYVVCRECLQATPTGVASEHVARTCPHCSEAKLGVPVYPTGRLPRQLQRHKEKVIQAFVFREGPVPPDREYLEELLIQCSPDVLEDKAELIGVPLWPWPEDPRLSSNAYFASPQGRGQLKGELEMVERADLRDEAGNRLYVVKRLAAAEKPERTEAEPIRQAGALFWFDWKAISEAGHPAFGAYVFRQLLPYFSPRRFVFPCGTYYFFDGELFGEAVIPQPSPEEADVMNGIVALGRERCYVVGVYMSYGLVRFAEIDRSLREAATLGYLGLTSYHDWDPDRFAFLIERGLGLPETCTIHVAMKFVKEPEGFYLSDEEIRALGFDVVSNR